MRGPSRPKSVYSVAVLAPHSFWHRWCSHGPSAPVDVRDRPSPAERLTTVIDHQRTPFWSSWMTPGTGRAKLIQVFISATEYGWSSPLTTPAWTAGSDNITTR